MTTAAPAREDRHAKPKARTRKGRVLLFTGAGLLGAVVLLWVLVHRVPWMGPLVANTLRAVIGSKNVTRLEELVYGIEDRVNRGVRSSEKPKAYWKTPHVPAHPSAAAPSATEPAITPFQPKDVGPVHKSWSAPGDGEWVAMPDSTRPDAPAVLYKTLLHPDRNRSWAEVFVVAIDLRQVTIHPVLGTREPSATEPVPADLARHGVIPEAQRATVLAAFNGGFMTEHGHWGMMLNGLTIVKPRDEACTLAAYADQTMRVGSWRTLQDSSKDMLWYRQAPSCMAEGGKLHPLLESENIRKWGATLDGNTVIRRSAVGLDKEHQVLFMGISNHTTAPVMALGMLHAGAADVAQLDVNWSYPKFVTYERAEAGTDRVALPLAEGFEFSPDEYIRKSSMRDFFYLTLRSAPTPGNH